MNIAVITCIQLLLKLIFCAHIRWQMIKNYMESLLLNLRICKVSVQNTGFITIHHYLKLLQTSWKMKVVGSMSAKLLKHNFPFKQVISLWRILLCYLFLIFVFSPLKTYSDYITELFVTINNIFITGPCCCPCSVGKIVST